MKPKLSLRPGQSAELRKRSHERYEPEPNTTAAIDVSGNTDFTPSIVALVMNESFKGCGLILPSTNLLQVGDTVVIKVGSVQPVRAEVKWRTQIDAQAVKVGLMYLD